MPRKFTTRKLAEKLGISQRTVQRHIKAGKIPAIKEGRGFKVETVSLSELAARLGVSAREAKRVIERENKEYFKSGSTYVVPITPGPYDYTDPSGQKWQVQLDGRKIPYHSESYYKSSMLRRRGKKVTLEEADNYVKPIKGVGWDIFINDDPGEHEGLYEVAIDDDTTPYQS